MSDAREALLKGVTRVLGVNVLNKLDVLLGKTDLELADRADGELGRGLLSLSDLTSLGCLLLSKLTEILSRLGHYCLLITLKEVTKFIEILNNYLKIIKYLNKNK